jgi:predicted dehydrogenase
VTGYEQFEEMLRDPKIDLIDICTPTDQHATMAVAALKAGKHVVVEKAIALTLAEADDMMAAAKKAGKQLFVAHVLPFFADFAFAAEAIQTGKFGKLQAGHFRRIIAKPTWSGDISDAAKTGGPAVDLHIHDTHFFRMLFGMPHAVSSAGVVENNVVQHLTTTYHYGSEKPAITCTSGAICMPGRAFVHGYELHFERGTMIYEAGAIPLTIYHADGSVETPTLANLDPVDCFAAELSQVVQSIETGEASPVLDGLIARDALELCLQEIEAVKSGKIIEIR